MAVSITRSVRSAAVADVIHAVLAIAATSALVPAVAAAAEPAPAASDDLQISEVIVTGSRIRGVAPVGSTVVTVGRTEIEKSAATTTAQLIQEVPQVFNLGVSENSRGQSGGSGNITYGTSINLRGLGPYSTLTIIDGHRAVPQGTTGQSIDPSIIPTLALERVEIVADGASALYGSDAVAGVVNLILRRNFEGVEVSARGGVGDDYNEHQVGAIAGYNWGSGHVMAAFENAYHSNLNGVDRDFFRGDQTARGGRDYRVVQCNPGNIVIPGATPGSTVSYAIPAGGVTQANRNDLIANTTNRCDNAMTQNLLPEQERNSLAVTANQTLTDRVSLFADGFWSRRSFENQVATQSGALTVRNTNPYFVAPPGSTATVETVNYSFGDQIPSNDTEGYSASYEATVGANIEIFSDWNLEMLYTYGHNNDLSISDHGIINANLAAALARTDPATALNPFSTAPNNAAALDGIAESLFYAPGDTDFQGWEAKIDGSLWDLPGGSIRAALGYEGQYLTNQSGLITGTWTDQINGITPRVKRTIHSGYAEVMVPIFGAANAIGGLHRLELNLAVRYDDYSDVGSTTNPKYGVNWSPIDGLTFRGTYGESFRAPVFSQVYGNSSALYVQNYSDPTKGGAITQGITLSGGNLDLEPETAETYTFGVGWMPSFAPGLSLDLSYFHIDYEKQITSYLSDLTILNRESQFDGTGIITRNPDPAFVAAMVATHPVRGVLPVPVTLYVDGRTNNLGTTVAAGFDFQGSYYMDTDAAGRFGFGLNATYFTQYDVAITPSAPLLDQLNLIYNPLKAKARGFVSWDSGGFDATMFVNYLNAYDNNLISPTQEVDAKTTFDLNVSYAFQSDGFWDGFKVGLDVVNITDEDPPYVNIAQSPNGGGGFDATLNNPVGRIISLSMSKKW